MSDAPPILITGSGRSGTGYLAALLSRTHLNVGHEGWWTLNKRRQPGLDVDVSWLGCFDNGYTGRVLAQVRSPLSSVPSIHQHEHKHPWTLLRRTTVPHTGDWTVDAIRIWYCYTIQALERAEDWWQLEAIDPDQLNRYLDTRLTTADLEAVPTSTNHRGNVEPFQWPDHPVTEAALKLGRRLGYDT